ncbi:MAG: hypothetical protein QG570_356 [Patescibacteria group bacterium]|nr:hypothetical protein [Patescibacteria group bacterium]
MTTPAHLPGEEFEDLRSDIPSTNEPNPDLDPDLEPEDLDELAELTNPLRGTTETCATPSMIEAAKSQFLQQFYAPLNCWRQINYAALTAVWDATYVDPCVGRSLTVTTPTSHLGMMKGLAVSGEYGVLKMAEDDNRRLLNIPLGVSLQDITAKSANIFYILLVNGVIMEIEVDGSHSFMMCRDQKAYDVNVKADRWALESMLPTYSGELSWLPETKVLRSSLDDNRTAENLYGDYISLLKLIIEIQSARPARLKEIKKLFTKR